MSGNGDLREISVDYLARVEGEGAMYLKLDGEEIVDLQFSIFEPPRFYEALLRGRRHGEAPDITSRICGICPVAYQMSAINAMEHAAGVNVHHQIRALRRLLYCGEWVESHALHVYMLHTPDFLGYESAIEMATDLPDVVTSALRLKTLGNTVMTLLGGREIHPINMRVGGFHRTPKRRELDTLVDELEWALETSEATVRLVSGFDFPDFEMPYEFVSLRHPEEYAITDGRIVSTKGLDIDVTEWDDHFEEIHVERSNALHARLRERGTYHVGPMARFTINHDKLTPRARAIADAKIVPPTSQNQRSIEEDLRQFVIPRTQMPDDELQWQLEQAIRNYDPCISCATHFLNLTVDRVG